MPYDLFGNHYSSARDAENAEMAQCAAIDADIAYRKIGELERQIFNIQQPSEREQEIGHLWQKIQELEQRIAKMEPPPAPPQSTNEKIEWLDRDHQEHEYFDCLERFDPIVFRRTVFADEKIEAIKTLLLNESISPETFRQEVGKILKS